MAATIRRLTQNDIPLLRELLTTFGEAFNDADTYSSRRPRNEYLHRLLGDDTFIALVALKDGSAVGGLAAYVLRKFEQERSEIYIYDLAVARAHRHEGIARSLIGELQKLAAARGAYVIYVQADKGIEDQPAIALCSALGRKEDVFHFDILVKND
jgi:aminoglycoside 3-N-acetyltransferase I